MAPNEFLLLGSAISAGKVEQAMRILSAHPELARQHFEGLTPLLIAACFSSMPGQEAVVTALLDRGADVNMGHCVGHPLSVAAGRGNVGVCRLLLDCGADIDMRGGEEGLSALMEACKNAHMDCVKLLLDRGAALNQTSSHADQPQLKSALSLAVVSGSAPCIRLLIAHGADVQSLLGAEAGLPAARLEDLPLAILMPD